MDDDSPTPVDWMPLTADDVADIIDDLAAIGGFRVTYIDRLRPERRRGARVYRKALLFCPGCKGFILWDRVRTADIAGYKANGRECGSCARRRREAAA